MDTFQVTHCGRDKMASISQTTLSLKYVPNGLIDNIAALVQKVAWHRTDDNPLSEAMMVCFAYAYVRHSAAVSCLAKFYRWRDNKRLLIPVH